MWKLIGQHYFENYYIIILGLVIVIVETTKDFGKFFTIIT